MIKKSQIKEVLLKYIVPLQKQYPDFYLGGSLALILQKHIPARDVKDLDIISPVSFGDLHETKFPYRGMVTSKKTYHIREIKTCLDFFHNPKAQYITVKFQGHTIKLSPVNEIIHAKENKIWSPMYKQKQENLKQIIKEVFTEIKAQPGKTGLKDNRIKLVIQSQTTSPNDNKLYGTLYVDDPESNFPKDSIVYSYEPSTDHMFLSSIRKENFDNLPKILKNKNIPHEYSDLDIVSGIHVDNLSKYFVLKKNMNEIKVQPVNKLNKPVKKVKITDKPYIDIDTSFIEDYILDYGEIDENPLEIYLDNHEIFDTLIRESEYINFILNGDYGLYFNSNPQEIDNVLTLNDPLNIKDYAEEQAKFLSSGNPEDESFYKEEMIMAIETIQDNIPKYTAAKKILKDKFTIISNNEFSVILTTSNMHGKFLYTMILKQDGYFNKNGEIVLYTDPQI